MYRRPGVITLNYSYSKGDRAGMSRDTRRKAGSVKPGRVSWHGESPWSDAEIFHFSVRNDSIAKLIDDHVGRDVADVRGTPRCADVVLRETTLYPRRLSILEHFSIVGLPGMYNGATTRPRGCSPEKLDHGIGDGPLLRRQRLVSGGNWTSADSFRKGAYDRKVKGSRCEGLRFITRTRTEGLLRALQAPSMAAAQVVAEGDR